MQRLVLATVCLVSAAGATGVSVAGASVAGASVARGTARSWRVTLTSRSAGTVVAIGCAAPRGCLLAGQLDAPPVSGEESGLAPHLDAVTCVSAGCVVVGQTAVTFRAWQSAGPHWRAMRFQPVVHGIYQGSLDSVTCVSSRDCLAVGNVDVHTRVDCPVNAMSLTTCETLVPVIERWDGARWTRQTGVPVPVLAKIALPLGSEQGFSSLDAVSCAGPRGCVAVGRVGSTSVGGSALVIGPAFADTWNGRSWRMTILPAPPGSGPKLTAISCSPGRRCVAVGSIRRNGTSEPYAAEDTGGIWSDVAPRSSGGVVLSSVSCVPDGECIAVGSRGWGRRRGPLVERWRAGRWSRRPAPAPADSRRRGGTQLISVSCTAARPRAGAAPGIGSCSAAGGYGHSATSGLPVAWFLESLGPVLPVRSVS